ncbi:MAG: SUMF1/EgtB/PvdO family nonheme iron enzyme, partial [Myxococcota bacterium]|nr:SUMF1/EgtB/PvdO family nonheme iron enzyme [Myxococcota bacterium]
MARLLLLGGLSACGGLLSGGPSCPEDMVLIAAGTTVVGTDERNRDYYQPRATVQHAGFCIDPYEFPNRKGELPATHHSWDEAAAACASVGKRLCTSLEWGRACRGQEGRKYTYGHQHDPTACNTPIVGTGPGKAMAPVAPSGSFPRCSTPEGIYDLGGNLSEWVSDPWTGAPEPFNQRAVVDPTTWRTLRGGTMWSSTFYGQECMSAHGHEKSSFK